MAKATTKLNDGPVDHGDGKPAVSLPAGSFDATALDEALSVANHDNAEEVQAAIAGAQTVVVADPEPAPEPAADLTAADLTDTATTGADNAESGKDV